MLSKRTLNLYLASILACTIYQAATAQWTVPLFGTTKKYSTQVIDTLKSWGFTDEDIASITLSDPLRPLDDSRIKLLNQRFGPVAFIALTMYPRPVRELGLIRYFLRTPFSEADLLLLCNAYLHEEESRAWANQFPIYPYSPLQWLILQTSKWLKENPTNPLFLKLIALFVTNPRIKINVPLMGNSTTILHIAVQNSNLLPVVALLLTRDDIQLDIRNPSCLTALELARQCNNQPAVLLIEERQRKQEERRRQTQEASSQSSNSESSSSNYNSLEETSQNNLDLSLNFGWIAEALSNANQPIPDELALFNNFHVPRMPEDIVQKYIDSRHLNQMHQKPLITGKNIAIASAAALTALAIAREAVIRTGKSSEKNQQDIRAT